MESWCDLAAGASLAQSPEWGIGSAVRARLLPTAAKGQEYSHLICCKSGMRGRHCVIGRNQGPLRIQQSQKIDLASDVKALGLLLRLLGTSLRCSKVAVALQVATVGGKGTLSIPKRREYYTVEVGQNQLLGSVSLSNPRASERLIG